MADYMDSVMDVAKYIYSRYKAEVGQKIDEMKLHKMLYFAQREAIIQTNEPLFLENFSGWKFGPVMVKIRKAYKDEEFDDCNYDYTKNNKEQFICVMNKVFTDYAKKDPWSLSRLTHGELSWQNSRKGIPEGENGTSKIKIADIRKDATRIKRRRDFFAKFNPINN